MLEKIVRRCECNVERFYYNLRLSELIPNLLDRIYLYIGFLHLNGLAFFKNRESLNATKSLISQISTTAVFGRHPRKTRWLLHLGCLPRG